MWRGWPSAYKFSLFIHHLLFRLNGLPSPRDTSAFRAFKLIRAICSLFGFAPFSLEILDLSLILLFSLISNRSCSINNECKVTAFTVLLGCSLPGIAVLLGWYLPGNAMEVCKRGATGAEPLCWSAPLCGANWAEAPVSEGGSQSLMAPMEELHSPGPDVKSIWILGSMKQTNRMETLNNVKHFIFCL